MLVKSITARHLKSLRNVASAILSDHPDVRIFALNGKMGAGKTTLIKAFCEVLQVEEIVSSPTFALVNEYKTAEDDSVFHFDFYRIKKLEEVFDIGYEEYFYSGDYCFIEWPEMVMQLLPEHFVEVNIEVGEEDERIFTYQEIKSL